MPIAIGVVTDFGAIDSKTTSLAPKAHAMPTALTSAVTAPANAQLLPVDIGPPRTERDSTIVLDVKVDETQDAARERVMTSRRDRILEGNPYRLGSEGQLGLSFLPPIPIGGLTAEETAAALGVTTRTVERDWMKARGWLYRALRDDAT